MQPDLRGGGFTLEAAREVALAVGRGTWPESAPSKVWQPPSAIWQPPSAVWQPPSAVWQPPAPRLLCDRAHVAPVAGSAPGSADPRLVQTQRVKLQRIASDVLPELQARALSPAQRLALGRILACRTRALGGDLEVCACGYAEPVFRSCGHRLCPECGSFAQWRWVQQAHARTYDVPHVHHVATLLPCLRRLARWWPAAVHALWLQCVVAVVKDVAAQVLGDGARVGVTAVLHTWNRWVDYHPHVHALVTWGGLGAAGDWVEPGPGEALLPGDLVADALRARLVARLRALRKRAAVGRDARGRPLVAPPWLDGDAAWDDLLAQVAGDRVHVYAKKTLPGAEWAFGYLARYMFQTALSRQRIEGYDPSTRTVALVTKRGERFELGALDLLERVLAHALPARFHRVRHAGLYAPRAADALEQGRDAITRARAAGGSGQASSLAQPDLAEQAANPAGDPTAAAARVTPPPVPATAAALYQHLTGVDLSRCPRCGQPLHVVPLDPGEDPAPVAARVVARLRRRSALQEAPT